MIARNFKDVITVFNWQHLMQMEKYTTNHRTVCVHSVNRNKQTNKQALCSRHKVLRF